MNRVLLYRILMWASLGGVFVGIAMTFMGTAYGLLVILAGVGVFLWAARRGVQLALSETPGRRNDETDPDG